MRPQRKQQAPHHFIRRWPRARRALRGPSELFQAIKVEDQAGLHTPRDMAYKLYAAVKEQCPKGWGIEVLRKELYALGAGSCFAASVRYFRKPK